MNEKPKQPQKFLSIDESMRRIFARNPRLIRTSLDFLPKPNGTMDPAEDAKLTGQRHHSFDPDDVLT